MATAKKPAPKKAAPKKPAKQNPDINELLLTELREIYSAEKQLGRFLPRLSRSIATDSVREAIDRRGEQGQRLVEALDEAFQQMEASPGRKKNVAAEGLIADAQEHIQEIEKGEALDAVLIAAVQKLEHYCIAAWGTARSIARTLGEDQVVEAMTAALDEGAELDEALTRLAEEELYPSLVGDDEDQVEAEAGADGEDRSFAQDDDEGGAVADEQPSGGKSRGKGKGETAQA